MAKRDVDSVDTAVPQLPESIELAEQWRVLGIKLRDRSPVLFAKVFEVIATCAVGTEDDSATA